MSNNARVIVFYGVCFEPRSEDAKKFCDLGIPVPKEDDPLTPMWLTTHGWRRGRDGVQLVQYSYGEGTAFGLAIAGSVVYGEMWMPLDLDTVPKLFDSTARGRWSLLRQFCDKWGLTWTPPRWWAVPYYG